MCVSTFILCSLYKLNQLTNVLLTPHAQGREHHILCMFSITEVCSPTSTAIMYCPICIAPFAIRSSTFITPPVSFVSLAAPNACELCTHTHTHSVRLHHSHLRTNTHTHTTHLFQRSHRLDHGSTGGCIVCLKQQLATTCPSSRACLCSFNCFGTLALLLTTHNEATKSAATSRYPPFSTTAPPFLCGTSAPPFS